MLFGGIYLTSHFNSVNIKTNKFNLHNNITERSLYLGINRRVK